MSGSHAVYLDNDVLIQCGAADIKVAIHAVGQAFLAHSRGDYKMPQKTVFALPNASSPVDRMAALSCYVGGEIGLCGIKWLGSSASNTGNKALRATATILLNCPKTGRLIAILDGTLISAMRTAAVSCVATKMLNSSPSILGCIGIGEIGKLSVLGLLNQFDSIKEVIIYARNHRKLDSTAIILREKFPDRKITMAQNPREACKRADVLLLATTSATPVVHYDDINEGSIVINVSLRDLDDDVYTSQCDIIIDDYRECFRKGKVLYRLEQDGLLDKGNIVGTISDVLAGKTHPPIMNHRVKVVFAAGLALHDISLAGILYKKALELGICKELPF